jgi:hypothetical protein
MHLKRRFERVRGCKMKGNAVFGLSGNRNGPKTAFLPFLDGLGSPVKKGEA